MLDYCRKNNIQIIYAGSSSKHHRYTESPYATTKYLVSSYVGCIEIPITWLFILQGFIMQVWSKKYTLFEGCSWW